MHLDDNECAHCGSLLPFEKPLHQKYRPVFCSQRCARAAVNPLLPDGFMHEGSYTDLPEYKKVQTALDRPAPKSWSRGQAIEHGRELLAREDQIIKDWNQANASHVLGNAESEYARRYSTSKLAKESREFWKTLGATGPEDFAEKRERKDRERDRELIREKEMLEERERIDRMNEEYQERQRIERLSKL